MEYKRQGNTEIEPLERIKNFNEFHTPLNEEERQGPVAVHFTICVRNGTIWYI